LLFGLGLVTFATVGGWMSPASAQPAASEPSSFVLSDVLDSCPQARPALASLPGGGLVAAWIENGRLRVRRFDRFGAVRFRDPAPIPTESHDLAVTAMPSGAFAVAWRETGRVRIWPFTAEGEGRGIESIPAPGGPGVVALASRGEELLAVWTEGQDESLLLVGRNLETGEALGPWDPEIDRFSGLEMAVQPNGDVWVLYRVSVVVTPDPLIAQGVRFSAEAPEEPVRFFEHFGVRDYSLAPDAGGGVVLTWIGEPLQGPPSGSADFSHALHFQRYGASSQPVGDPVEVAPDPGEESRYGTNLSVDASGNVTLIWIEFDADLVYESYYRSYGPDNQPLGPVAAAGSNRFSDPLLCFTALLNTITGSGPGEVTWALWRCVDPPEGTDPREPCLTQRLEGRRAQAAGDRTLLLGDGRFRVTVDWEDPFNGGSGTGHAIQDTRDTGGFWFFDPANQELTVKVLDGRAINGHFWFFYGALSNVAYEITVTDQLTGREKTYDNPPRRFGSFADTFAFRDP